LTVDVVHRRVTMGDREVALSRVEYLLLRALARSAGKVLAHRELLEEVWGPAFAHNVNLLRVSVSKLRRKIEPDPARPEYILNHAGVGYRLRPPT
jgi:two-component system KDP operon response regulator KdpE